MGDAPTGLPHPPLPEVVSLRTLSLPPLQRLSPHAPLIVRLIVGTIMLAHGWEKLTQMTPAGFGEGMLAELGVPAPVVFGWAVTLVELVGGLALIIGAFTRIAALAVMTVLAGAVILVKSEIGLLAPMGAPLPGAELDLALIAGLLAVLILGPGRPSIDHVIGVEETVPTPEPVT